MTADPIGSSNSTTATSNPSGSSSTATGADSLANEQTFLQLFVAQLKNQDPETPQDPTQFVSQLAQMSDLEQSLQMRQDLDGILQILQTNGTSTSQTSGK